MKVKAHKRKGHPVRAHERKAKLKTASGSSWLRSGLKKDQKKKLSGSFKQAVKNVFEINRLDKRPLQ